jgi:hypothetical protein
VWDLLIPRGAYKSVIDWRGELANIRNQNNHLSVPYLGLLPRDKGERVQIRFLVDYQRHHQPHASATSSEAKGRDIVNWVCVLVFAEQEDKTKRLAYLVILLADEGPEEDLGIWCMAAATKSAIDVVPQHKATTNTASLKKQG